MMPSGTVPEGIATSRTIAFAANGVADNAKAIALSRTFRRAAQRSLAKGATGVNRRISEPDDDRADGISAPW
ncbi:broad specificity polyphosphatase/5'/3'-nucleotidase SurE [Novosphingobium hassiacum]|uniref:Broad specificity polyphosphatase/5'/3'-nucleotidase SurE n=1 Tax=Novosphingobium hassiacum TaxID=173676 RepID=A0A7W6EXV3_9SPHN|nr:broad specificity polyphosphatase/5'/3'-nucleotidase SurE [Novosphingobium hassiacum]